MSSRCFAAWSKGDRASLDQLMPVVYDELRNIARSYLKGERHTHTLQPTALVHEAYVRLIAQNLPPGRAVHTFMASPRS